MEEIKNVEYYDGDRPYRLNGDYFNKTHIQYITAHLQKKYAAFAKRINQENGRLEIHLWHKENDTIRHQAVISGISADLIKELNMLVNGSE